MRLAAGSEVTPWLRLVRPLGEGGMGSVWVCEDGRRGEEVAVKFVLAKHIRDDPELVARFRREASVCQKIRSHHVVRAFESGETADGVPFLVMELLEGETLADRLDRDRWLDVEDAIPIVLQIADALRAAHTLGLVHRDIKPENVFLAGPRASPLVKVLDFGTVKRTLAREESIVTATGVMVGTPEYMSPEQVLGSRGVDHRADLWALGVVAYEMLVGQEPFRGGNPQALCLAICTASFQPIRERLPELPHEIEGWFARALARSPAARFDSASEMAAELAAITGFPLETGRIETWQDASEDAGFDSVNAKGDGASTTPDEVPTQQLSGRALLASARGVFRARSQPAGSYAEEPVTTVKRDPPILPSDPLGRTAGQQTILHGSNTPTDSLTPVDEEPTRQARPTADLLHLVQEQETARQRRAPSGKSEGGRAGRSRSSQRRRRSQAGSASDATARRSTSRTDRPRRTSGRPGPAEAAGSPSAASARGPTAEDALRQGARPRSPDGSWRKLRSRLLLLVGPLLAVTLVVFAAFEAGRPPREKASPDGPEEARVVPPAGATDRAESPPQSPRLGPSASRDPASSSQDRPLAAAAGTVPVESATSANDQGGAPPTPGSRPTPYRGRDAGYLSLECEPACDEVVVGDEAIGPTPVKEFALRPGVYRIELLAGALPTQVISLKILPGRTTSRLVLMDDGP